MKEFRAFVLRGNVIDLAVGVVIGAAFASVVSSLVADVLTPLLGVFGTPDFSDAAVTIGRAELRYGRFLNALINLLTVALALFVFVVKPVNHLMERRRTEPDVESTTRACPHCRSSIPLEASVCAFCTRDVPAAAQA